MSTIRFKETRIKDPGSQLPGRMIPAQSATTRDQVTSLIITRIRTNRYDAKFLSDIRQKYLLNSRPLSEGQNELWEKIVYKYRKQLKKQGVLVKDIFELDWVLGVYSKDEIVKDSYFDIEDWDEDGPYMVLRFKFDKKMIEQVRALVFDDNARWLKRGQVSAYSWGSEKHRYDFTWNGTDKQWSGPYNPHLFKGLLHFANANNIELSPTVQAVVDALNETYGTDEAWCVRLMLKHDRLYINNINEVLNDKLAAYDLTDIHPANIEAICSTLAIEPPVTIDRRIRQLIMHKPFAADPHAYEIRTIEDAEMLKHYLTANELNAMISIGVEGPLYETFKDTDHWCVNAVESYQRDLLHDGKIDTLITSTPPNILFTTNKRLGELKDKIKKFIYINEVLDNPNKG